MKYADTCGGPGVTSAEVQVQGLLRGGGAELPVGEFCRVYATIEVSWRL